MRWLTRSVSNLTAFRLITTGWREGTQIWFERTENDDLIVETSIWASTGVYKKFACKNWPYVKSVLLKSFWLTKLCPNGVKFIVNQFYPVNFLMPTTVNRKPIGSDLVFRLIVARRKPGSASLLWGLRQTGKVHLFLFLWLSPRYR